MIKRIISLIVSLLLLLSTVSGFAQDTENEVVERKIKTVLDVSDSKMIKKAGVSRNASFTRDNPYTLFWGDEDIKRTVKLDCKSDWTEGSFLEFWMYSPAKTESTFAIAVISDNTQTTCTDFYEVIVRGNYKGWKLFSIPFEDFVPVHKPAGFEKIDRIELWPKYGEYSVAEDAKFYLDNMYVTNISTMSEDEGGEEVVLFDFTTGEEVWSYDTRYPNSMYAPAPDTGESALLWKDTPRQWSGGVGGVTLTPKETDWSYYNTLEFNLYCKMVDGKESEGTITFVSASDNDTTNSRDYYYEKVAVDWKDERVSVKLKIGSGGNQSSGGVPLGWDQITGIELWFTNGTDDPDIHTELYFESIKLKNIDYSAQWKEPQYIDDAPQTTEWYDFAAKINERYPNNEHPRLLVDQEYLDWVKDNYKEDKFLSKAVPALLESTVTLMETNHTPMDTSAAADAAATLALAYNITGEQKYKDACWEKVLIYTMEASTWNPGNSRLELGDTGRPAAITYDLMYNHWTDEERLIARNAFILHLLRPERAIIVEQNGADTQLTNWNPIINSGVGMVALAIADEEGYADAANLVLNRIWRVIPNCFKYYGPDGAGFEGPDYWNYMMPNYLLYEGALLQSIGEEDYPLFSVLDEYGMEKTGDFALHVLGTSSTFNFYDGRARGIASGADFFLARYFGRPEFAGRVFEGNGSDAQRSILFYRPGINFDNWRDNIPLDYSAGGYVQFGAMRASFEKGSTGMYVGYKGNGRNPATHGRLDAGAFVLDSQGTRFIELPSNESYGLPEMFGNLRYTYYRNRAEGSNTLVIGPGINQNTENDGTNIYNQQMDQKYLSNCEIIKTESSDGGAYAVVDLTDAYSQSATSVKRGFALINGRDSFLLQDEIKLNGSKEVYSFMHTSRDIEIASDGKSALLSTKDGKKMKVKLLAPENGTLSQMAPTNLPTSPQREGTDNSTFKKLAVQATVSGSATISVLFTPYYGDGSYDFTLDEVTPIDKWDNFLKDPVPIDGIYLAGTPLSSFKKNQTSFVVSEDTPHEITAYASSDVQIDITQAQKIGDTALIKATSISEDRSTVYAVTFSAEVQTRLDEWFYYAPVDFLYSANKVEIPNVMDGSYSSGWSNAGPQWLAMDLGKPKLVSEVMLYWNANDERVETFDISVSDDAENWDVVWEGESVLTNEMVSYKFDPVMTRYVKVMGYKNTKNDWTSINEFYIPSTGSGFSDIEGSWAKQAIEDMAKVGMVEGTSDSTFTPDAPLSRAAYLTMLERVFSIEKAEYTGKINDVKEYDWFMPYVEAAYALDLIPVEMLTDGNFRPNENITREEICALTITFWEKYANKISPVTLNGFTDKDSISAWAAPFVEKALSERIIQGVESGIFAPKQTATRAQAATILKRIYIKTK